MHGASASQINAVSDTAATHVPVELGDELCTFIGKGIPIPHIATGDNIHHECDISNSASNRTDIAQQKDTVDPKVEQQIRALAQKYDEAINKHDSVAIASLYAQNGVWRTYDHGSFYGQKAIEKGYARWVFTTWQVRNHFTSVNRIFARGNEIRSSGTWSCTFQNTDGGPANDEGLYSWVIIRERYLEDPQ
jgi:ketosteroid isomerase-like protein